MKNTFKYAALCVCFGLLACDYASPIKHAQVSTARVSQDFACQKHLKRFLDGKDEGLTCDESRIRASAENPLCNLSFTCPAQDAGAEGGMQ